MKSYNFITFGETMIRFSTHIGQRLEQCASLNIHVGGSESNVGAALARLGWKVLWISKLVENPWGWRIAHELRFHGIDISQVHWTSQGRIGVFYMEVSEEPRPSQIIYDRSLSAVALMNPDEMDYSVVAQGELLHLSGITPALSENCHKIASRMMDVAQDAGMKISFDLNYRARLWTPDEAEKVLSNFCAKAHILFITLNDARTVFKLTGSYEEMLEQLMTRFKCEVVVMTVGAEGAVALKEGKFFKEGPFKAKPIERLGSGDAFDAGFLYGYSKGDVAEALRYGNALAAFKYSIPGDMAFITKDELEQVLAGGSSGIKR
jgi:2-dehydro-3-deoxygluconokinase